VAWAFAAATTADVVGEILLIAGDDSHKIKYGDVGAALAATRGLTGALPKGRPGNPDNDDAGSSRSGWTPHARRKLCSSSTIRGTTCSPRCARTRDGLVTYCRSSLRSFERY
jgi:hypothetical protein